MDEVKDFFFLNSEIIEESIPFRSLFYGEGVFETFRCKGNIPRFFDDHLDRLEKGANLLAIPFPERGNIKEQVLNSLDKTGIRDAYVKICLLSTGNKIFYHRPTSSSILIVVGEYRGSKEQVSVCVSSRKRSQDSVLSRIKTFNYLGNIIARREAIEKGYDDTIFLNVSDEVTEASSSNIFWMRGRGLFTPYLESGILSGITRKLILEIAGELGYEINERKFKLTYLLNSDFAFLTNSLVGMIYVNRINEQYMPSIPKEFLKFKERLFKRLSW